MKRVLVTGLSGTVAPYMKDLLESKGIEVLDFKHRTIDIDSKDEIIKYLDSFGDFDFIYHFANGPMLYQVELARYAQVKGIGFMFTSTESVYSDKINGPYDVNDERTAYSDYGKYKIEVENNVIEVNKNAFIIRLGWQLGDEPLKNNMLAFLKNTMENEGVINASEEWIPAVNYIGATVDAIYNITSLMKPSTYNLDSNKEELNFYQIVCRLNDYYKMNLQVNKVSEPKRNGRILDDRITIPNILDHLK